MSRARLLRRRLRTMTSLAQRGINPTVVSDQTGCLTFATNIAAGWTYYGMGRP